MSGERCTLCGQLRDFCPTHDWREMRRLLTGQSHDLPGRTGDALLLPPGLSYREGTP